jgi:hypothetical protein
MKDTQNGHREQIDGDTAVGGAVFLSMMNSIVLPVWDLTVLGRLVVHYRNKDDGWLRLGSAGAPCLHHVISH